jgi:hypothetical protein
MNKTHFFYPLIPLVLLSACSEEKTPEPPNQAPSITLESQVISIDEGKETSLSFVVADDKDTSNVTVQAVSNNKGMVNIDMANMVVLYKAPVLELDKRLVDNIVLQVKDSEGGVTETTISVEVNDIDSPVKLTIIPPEKAEGFENTQKDDELVFAYPEQDELNISFRVDDADNDNIDIEYEVDEGLVFWNQITPTSEDGIVTLSLPIPSIDSPSASFSIKLSATDNDTTTQAQAYVTVINNPVLTWDGLKSSKSLSEKDGGLLVWKSSEKSNYPATYDIKATYADGKPLDFEFNYTADTSGGTIQVAPSGYIQGDKTILFTITMSNAITLASGETYLKETVLTKTVVLVDDRDDDFADKLSRFYSMVEKFNDAKDRDDDLRVFDAWLTVAFAQDKVGFSTKKNILKQLRDDLEINKDEVISKIENVTALIDSQSEDDAINVAIDDFFLALENYGSNARAHAINQLTWEEGLPKLPQTSGFANVVNDDYLSSYVGNLLYGSYQDQDKTKWVFKQDYYYMSVVNYATFPACEL